MSERLPKYVVAWRNLKITVECEMELTDEVMEWLRRVDEAIHRLHNLEY